MNLNLFLPLTKVDAVNRVVYGVAAVEEPDKSGEIFDYDTSKPNFVKWSGDFEKVTDGKSLGNVRAMHGKVAAGKLEVIEFDDVNKCITVAAKIVDENEWQKVEAGVYTGFSVGGSYEKRWTDGDLKRYTAAPSEISIVDNPCMPSALFTMIKMDGSTEERHFTSVVADPVEKTVVLPTNDAVAAKATELAKAAGGKWTDFIEQATAELTKALNPEPAPAAAVPEPIVADPAAPAPVEKTEPAEELSQVWKAKDGQTFAKKADAVKHNEELALAAADPAALLKASVDKLGAAVAKAEKGETEPKAAIPRLVKAEGHDLAKDMYQVSQLASLIDSLQWLLSDVKWEAAYEDDKSKVPASLKQNLTDMINTLTAMVKEETKEVLDNANMEMAARPKAFDGLAKLFEGDAASLEKLALLGSKHVPETPAPVEKTEGGDLQKALDGANEKIAGLMKTIAETTPVIEALAKRVETIEKTPVPGGPRATELRVVDKAADDTLAMTSLTELAKNNPGQIVDQLIRLAQQSPQRSGG